MGKKDPRVDGYIISAAEFARPILQHLRKLVHQGCPEVEETVKWSVPAFTYKGPLCMMAAFKKHAMFRFHKGELILEAKGGAMGQFGALTSRKDLPSDKVLLGYIRKAVSLNDEGVKVPRPAAALRREITVPDFFTAALKKNKKAQATFDKFSYSHKKEYVQWLTEAKREETRAKRLETALAWLADGKPRNWQYMKC